MNNLSNEILYYNKLVINNIQKIMKTIILKELILKSNIYNIYNFLFNLLFNIVVLFFIIVLYIIYYTIMQHMIKRRNLNFIKKKKEKK